MTDLLKKATHAVGVHRIPTRPNRRHVRVELDQPGGRGATRAVELAETGLAKRV